MILSDLLTDSDVLNYKELSDSSLKTEVSSIHYSTKDLKPGGLFIAVKGFSSDGHDYIDDAISKGAAAVVSEKEINVSLPVIKVKDSRKEMAALASNFYKRPSEELFVIGITGTNGKTTITYIVENILKEAGFNVGVIGTVNYRYSGKEYPNPRTTPEALDLQRIMREMINSGVKFLIMEVSSHAIDLFRVDKTWFDVAAFTNLSQDHLDYHSDMEDYFSCKKRLFTDILNSGPKKDRAVAVINSENERGFFLAEELTRSGMKVYKTGTNENNSVRAYNIKHSMAGMAGCLKLPDGSFDFRSEFAGRYNLENIYNSAGIAAAVNLPIQTIRKGIESSIVPGRLERINSNKNRFVFVDYAHTPDALENVLKTLKELATGKLICVFGCGGDRDKGKRPLMGKIACELSDLTIITSDNPRSEAPNDIIRDILDGISEMELIKYDRNSFKSSFSKNGYMVEVDREKAINSSIELSSEGDTIIIAGKGHETYQEIGGQKIDFDDRIIAEKALN